MAYSFGRNFDDNYDHQHPNILRDTRGTSFGDTRGEYLGASRGTHLGDTRRTDYETYRETNIGGTRRTDIGATQRPNNQNHNMLSGTSLGETRGQDLRISRSAHLDDTRRTGYGNIGETYIGNTRRTDIGTSRGPEYIEFEAFDDLDEYDDAGHYNKHVVDKLAKTKTAYGWKAVRPTRNVSSAIAGAEDITATRQSVLRSTNMGNSYPTREDDTYDRTTRRTLATTEQTRNQGIRNTVREDISESDLEENPYGWNALGPTRHPPRESAKAVSSGMSRGQQAAGALRQSFNPVGQVAERSEVIGMSALSRDLQGTVPGNRLSTVKETNETRRDIRQTYDYPYISNVEMRPGAQSRRQKHWASMALDFKLRESWYSLFGKMKKKWAAYSDMEPQVGDAAFTSNGQKYADGKRKSSDTDKTDDRSNFPLRVVLIVTALLTAVLLAIFVPIGVVFWRGNADASDQTKITQYNYIAKILNREFAQEMGVIGSEAFLVVSSEFCGGLKTNFSDTRYTVKDCYVRNITQGSIVVDFIIIVSSKEDAFPTGHLLLGYLGLQSNMSSVNISNFQVSTNITVNPTVKIDSPDYSAPSEIKYNMSCHNETNRCKTKYAVCIDGRCSCPQTRYYVNSDNTCHQKNIMEYSFVVKIINLKFDEEMSNTYSEAFLNVSTTFCSALRPYFSPLANNFTNEGCVVSNIRNGSILIDFKIVFSSKEDTPPVVDELLGYLGLLSNESSVNISLFQVSTDITHKTRIPIDSLQNIFPKEINYNLTCNKETNMCKTKYAQCIDGRCSCPQNRYYVDSDNSCLPIVCNTNISIANGSLNTSGIYFGSNLTVKCNEGYEMLPSNFSYLTCTRNRTWGSLPSCKIKTCVDFAVPANATIDSPPVNRTYNEKISVTCENGFDIDGMNEAVCTANRTWSHSSVCRRVTCQNFTAPAHAAIDPAAINRTNQRFGDKIIVSCLTGFEIEGGNETVCRANKTWSNFPACRPVKCENFTTPDNATLPKALNTINQTYGDKIIISCITGFEIEGVNETICQANKKWSSVPTCKRVNCSQPHLPNNVITKTNQSISYLYDTHIDLACNEGFYLSGANQITCMANRSWSDIPTCLPVNCSTYSFPPNSLNVTVSLEGKKFGYEVNISCNEGYGMNGSATVKCLASGNWSDSPTCKLIDCGELESPQNGSIAQSEGTTFNMTRTFACNPGYKIKNESVFRCTKNGNWSGTPQCILKKCSVPIAPTHGVFAQNITMSHNFTIDTNISIMCSDGFDISGNSTIVCMENETWSQYPVCIPVDCGNPDQIENAEYLNVSVTTYNSTFDIDCQEGFRLSNNTTVRCRANGTWSEYPDCTAVNCGNISAPLNGTIVNNTGIVFGDTVQFRCNTGFELMGNSFATCMANETWSTFPTCSIKNCGAIGHTGNGNFTYQNGLKTYGSVAYLNCTGEYRRIGRESIKCLANGKWESLPFCYNTTCSEFIPPEHSSVINNTLAIECDEHYHLVGDATVECYTANNTWRYGTCKPMCEDFTLPKNSQSDFDNMTVYIEGNMVNVSCNEGFEPQAITVVTCQANMTWTKVPNCVQMYCLRRNLSENIQILNETSRTIFNVSEGLNVSCKSGYRYKGDNVKLVTCSQNKTWNPIPECEPVSCSLGNVSEMFILNQTIRYRLYEVNTTVTLSCEAGYRVNGTGNTTCKEDGKWSNTLGCAPVSCSMYTLPQYTQYVNISEGNMSSYDYNFTMELKCEYGYSFVNQNMIYVTCGADGMWHSSAGNPQCDVQGMVYFFETENVFTSGQNATLTCSLTNIHEWTNIVLLKVENAYQPVPLLVLSNVAGNITYEPRDSIKVNYSLQGAVTIALSFQPVTCSEKGMYVCANIASDRAFNASSFDPALVRQYPAKSANATVDVIGNLTLTAQKNNTGHNVTCSGQTGLGVKNSTELSIEIDFRNDLLPIIIDDSNYLAGPSYTSDCFLYIQRSIFFMINRTGTLQVDCRLELAGTIIAESTVNVTNGSMP